MGRSSAPGRQLPAAPTRSRRQTPWPTELTRSAPRPSTSRGMWARPAGRSTGDPPPAAPAAPTAPALLPADDSGVIGDGITNVKRPHLIGTAAANLTIQLIDASGTVWASTTTGSGSAYSVTP